jgi:hypothetical protein
MKYQDFDLSLERAADGFVARVLEAPGGPVPFQLPFSETRLENFLLRLGRTRRAVRRVESSEMQAAKAFGSALFAAVFSGNVDTAFHARLEDVRTRGMGLRIRLHLADPELADLPWEYLHDPRVNRFLALSIQTPLVRYLDLPGAIQPIAVTPPIRALVMISSPSDYPSLDVEAEWTKLTAALADLQASGQISIDLLDNATLPALQRKLRKARYHIFHFIGHGEFDQAAQEGVLLLEDERHRGHRVGSQYLGMLLHDHDSLRVAILNACEGARTSRLDPFAGSAQTLVQQGIPAVIAMQFEIADDVASTFAHEFYGALADGYPIDAALTEARKAIFAGGRDVEWGTPVLYLRAPDGRIFDVDRQALAAAGTPARVPLTTAPAAPLVATGPARDSGSATALLQAADVALANGEYLEALALLAQARALDPALPALRELADVAEQQQAVAETRARRRQALDRHLAAASELIARSEFQAALVRVREALRLQSTSPEALRLQARIRRSLARESSRSQAGPLMDATAGGAAASGVREPRLPVAPAERGSDAPASRPAAGPVNDESDLID